MLSPEQLAERRNFLGASEAGAIISGQWHNLWAIKTGLIEPENLDWNFAVQMGIATEELNLRWYSHTTGHALERYVVRHPTIPWMRASLDGYDRERDAIIECKTVNAYSKIQDVVQRYIPQCMHAMVCAEVDLAILSIIIGTSEPVLEEIPFDGFYAAQYVDRAKAFWQHVVDGTEPTEGKPLPPPSIPREKMRKVDMTGNNAWAAEAFKWIQTRSYAQEFERATKTIKAMVEPDVSEATGHGIIAKRDKRGVSIKEL